MRVDFYQLSRDPAEAVLPLIAQRTLKMGERLLVVSADADQLDRIDAALWSRIPDSFLAHGRADGPHDARQPILLSSDALPRNGARFCALADGVWRESEPPFERCFYLFSEATLDVARECWRQLRSREQVERRFWKQGAARGWVEGP